MSLTLSQVSIWQGIQKTFQYVGYFNRPLSAVLYLGIVIASFVLYLKTLDLVRKNLLTRKLLWKIVIGISIILFISYNAFSYDLFNYIFDAKIMTFYHQNPYEHKALDYPGDPMLSFMHWTHRTYPYGPAWLLITLPLSFMGLGYFLVTFYLFKALMVASYIGCAYFIEKIAKKVGINPLIAVSAFALNPLVIVESLVSGHNDIVMMFFALAATYYFFEKKVILAVFALGLSIGLKFATFFMLPALIMDLFVKVSKETVIKALTLSMVIALVAAIGRTNFQPWYLLFVIPFASLIANRLYIFIPLVVVSLFALLQYLPFIYLGNWDPPVPLILNYAMLGSIVISIVLVFGWRFFRTRRV